MYRNRFHNKKNNQNRSRFNGNSSAEVLRAIRSVQLSTQTQASPSQQVYTSIHQFSDFNFSPQIQKNLLWKGYTVPTPIQDQTIPQILAGKDVIGIANTGTGKTAAFLLPLIQKVYQNKMEKVLIVTPTRELAVQIHEELNIFAKGLGIYSVLCVGGTNMRKQKEGLRQHPHFVVGTPGRLKDLISEKSLYLSQFANVVLDEADRMVDIGFINDIRLFISLLPTQRQSLFFSATISAKVQGILQKFVHNPVTVSVKMQDTADNIEQNIIKVERGYKKIDTLHDLLVQDGFEKVLIFGRTKWGVQKLTEELIKRGFKAGAIHGNKRQNQRQKTLDQFKRNDITILLATDVASRGLDIHDVSHVINYDIPATYEDYIHRIGRTGRANKRGIAVTFEE